MKMYLPFGDWSNDGHGEYKKVLINAPSMQHLLNAELKIKEKYGKDFFETFAQNYLERSLSEKNIQALKDSGIKMTDIFEDVDVNNENDFYTFDEWIKIENGFLEIEEIIKLFIYLLNAYGANIMRLDEYNEIPMICNWTCNGFETVGYGCYD